MLKNIKSCYKINGHADVVELADALASGASGSNPVRVQVPPSAPVMIEPLVTARGLSLPSDTDITCYYPSNIAVLFFVNYSIILLAKNI